MVYCLTLQQDGVEDFPNRVLYDSKILTPKGRALHPSQLKWPGSQPTLFCDLAGVEASVYQLPGLPREHAIRNQKQAEFAVSNIYEPTSCHIGVICHM